MDFASCILSISVFLGITIGLFLFLVKSEKQRANTILGILILIVTIYVIPSFLHKLGLLDQFPHFIKLRILFSMAFGPLTYIYVKHCIQKDFELTGKTLLHFIPFGISVLYAIPFLVQSGDEKMATFLSIIHTGELAEPYYIPLIRAFYNICYFFLSLRVILLYKKYLANEVSNIDDGFHRWLIFFTSSLWLPIISVTLFSINGFNSLSLELVYLSIFLFLAAVYLFILFKPAVFHPFPHQMQEEKLLPKETKKYESSNLKNEQKEKYLQKLMEHMVMKKPYREPELTLSSLSEQVKIPSHHLSQLINEKLDCHFLDFINGHRVKEAQEKLLDASLSNYTIEAIAYEVGFNSKSTFYNAFKKVAKTTPASYRKAHLKMVV